MKNGIFGKGLIFGIVILFLGASIIPIAGSLSVEKNSSLLGTLEELNTVTKTGSRDYNITLYGTMGNNGWYVSCVGIGISGCGGCETVLFKIDDGSWFTYTAPFFVCGDGHHCVEAIVIDQYGNQTHLGPVFFKIDRTPPEVTVTVEKIGFMKWRVTVNVSDATSGINKVECYFDGVLQTTVTSPPFIFTWIVTWKFRHIVTQIMIIAYDDAGNNASSPPITPTSYSQSQQSDPQVNPSLNKINQLFHNIIYNIILRHQMTNR